MLEGGEYDMNGDGIPDFDAYFRFCGDKPINEKPYLIRHFRRGEITVDLSHLGKGMVTIPESEADLEEIYQHAPKCP